MSGPERVLSSCELCSRWGWRDEDLLEVMRMGLPAYEPGTKRALAADDITRLGELVSSGGTIDVRYQPADVEQFQRDHPDIFPRGVMPRRPKVRPTEPLRMSVKKVAERWTCSLDQIRRLVVDGLLSPPEGAGPEGWFDRKAFQAGHDTPTSNREIFTAEQVWEKAAAWKPEAIREFERNHPQIFEKGHLTSVPQVTRPSPPVTPVGSSGLSPRTNSIQRSPAKGEASQADEPAPATASDVARGTADARREITNEDLEAGVEVAVEMCRWWGKQPEDGKRPMTEAIAHVRKAFPHLCKEMSETRLKMIASKADPKPVEERPGRRN